MNSESTFLDANTIRHITELHPYEASGLQLYIYREGWVNLVNLEQLEEGKVFVNGYFPAKIIECTEVHAKLGFPPSLVEQYSHHSIKFSCSVDPDLDQVGLTSTKLSSLGMASEHDACDLYFTETEYYHQGSGDFDLDPDDKTLRIVVLESDLEAFCKQQGIIGFESKMQSMLPQKINSSPISTSMHLHDNTSQGLIDLIEANNTFWGNFDPTQQDTAPLKESVKSWFVDKGYSESLSEKMDTILRGGRSRSGGTPKIY